MQLTASSGPARGRERRSGREIADAKAGQFLVEVLNGLDVVLFKRLARDEYGLHLDDFARILPSDE